jgi:cytochrome c553
MRWLVLALAMAACDPPAPVDVTHDRWWRQPHDMPVHPVAIEPTSPERAHALHLEDLAMIERDLISGKLREAQTLAFLLTGPPDASMARRPFGAAYVEAAALDLVTAPCLDAAIRSEAQLAVACARCHVDAKQLPEPSVLPKPDGGLTPAARAATHRWAIDRVREGLALPADSPWRDGLTALAEIPPPATAVESHLQDVARADLATLPDLDQRGVAYAHLLETCASCHTPHRELSACVVPR